VAHKKTRRSVIAAASIVGAAVAVPASPAAASYPTCGTLGHYFDGYYNYSPGPLQVSEGNSAALTVRYGSVCDSDTSADTVIGGLTTNPSASWEMLNGAADSSGHGTGYSQAGFLRWYGSSDYSFAEYNDFHGQYNRKDDFAHPLSQGSTYKYQTQYNPGCTCLQNLAAGVQINQTSFNPTGTFATPWQLQYFGEVHYRESDIPGNPTVKTNFTHIQREGFGEVWTSALPTLSPGNDNIYRWDESSVNSCSGYPCFDIWTYDH